MPGPSVSPAVSFGLLLLRVTSGAMLVYGHGWAKLANFQERAARFSDPLNIGSDRSLMLTIFAEVFCALLVAIGFGTRFAAGAIVIMFAVIVFKVHGGDPFRDRELAMLFGSVYLCLVFTGGGAWALDSRWGPKVKFGGGK